MEVPLKAALINYFVQLEKTHEKWEEFFDNLKRPIQGLTNQSEQYCHVISKEVDNAEICKLNGVRERLVFQISRGIEDEVSLILNEMRRLKNHVEDLKMKFNRLDIARSEALLSEPSFAKLINGRSTIPRLDILMEWSIESQNHNHQLCVEIFENFQVLDYRNHENVEKWAKSIDQLKRKQGQIKYIMGFTQFLIKEPVK